MIDVYKIVDTKMVQNICKLWCETYYRYGRLLKNYSAGSYPGVMYLKKINDGYKSNEKQKYAEDGALLEESIYKLCKGHPIVAAKNAQRIYFRENKEKRNTEKNISDKII